MIGIFVLLFTPLVLKFLVDSYFAVTRCTKQLFVNSTTSQVVAYNNA